MPVEFHVHSVVPGACRRSEKYCSQEEDGVDFKKVVDGWPLLCFNLHEAGSEKSTKEVWEVEQVDTHRLVDSSELRKRYP